MPQIKEINYEDILNSNTVFEKGLPIFEIKISENKVDL